MRERTSVLVTGGAGYVGSAVVRTLSAAGYRPVVVDDLSTGHRLAVGKVPILKAAYGNKRVEAFVRRHRVRAVVHTAASCLVGESVKNPALYYENNLKQGLEFLEMLRRSRVRRLVFCSTAAVYGEPQAVPIPEDHPQRPVNPYGETKAAFEHALHWYCEAYGFSAVALRFFNAAGADEDGRHGEDHPIETHLIPRVMQHALGRRSAIELYGTDYATPDGTAIRDYVHVRDLAVAHLSALERCRRTKGFSAFNLGTGTGTSVREVLREVERVSGKTLKIVERPRRAGDPARLVASNEKARKLLGWSPGRPLGEIVASAWRWHEKHRRGYRSSPGLVSSRNAVLKLPARSR
ncbi:MAG: UDP-glucose 4-epimerase GalE [Acidobacteriota bacterium]